MYYFSAEEIMRLFLIDPLEGSSPDEVYARKLREARKMGGNQTLVGRNYGYSPYSLFQSIKDNWVLEPIEVDISNRLIHDGLHRIACAYAIDPYRPIPIRYV